MRVPPPPLGTKWTRRVPHPVPIGHAASLTPYGLPDPSYTRDGPSDASRTCTERRRARQAAVRGGTAQENTKPLEAGVVYDLYCGTGSFGQLSDAAAILTF